MPHEIVSLQTTSASDPVPALFHGMPDAGRRFWEFFTVNIRNANTRRACFKAVQGLQLAQQMAGHESARTTGLYDRRNDQISLDEVDRIVY